MPQEIPSSEAALPTGTCVFSRVEQQKKLLLADCPETACKQLDSKVLLKDKRRGGEKLLPPSAAQLLLHCCSVQAELGDLIEDSEALLGMGRAVQAEQMVHYFWYPARHSRDISRGLKKKVM